MLSTLSRISSYLNSSKKAWLNIKKLQFSSRSFMWMLSLMKSKNMITKTHKSIVKVILDDKISSVSTISFHCHQLLPLKQVKRFILLKELKLKVKLWGRMECFCSIWNTHLQNWSFLWYSVSLHCIWLNEGHKYITKSLHQKSHVSKTALWVGDTKKNEYIYRQRSASKSKNTQENAR